MVMFVRCIGTQTSLLAVYIRCLPHEGQSAIDGQCQNIYILLTPVCFLLSVIEGPMK